MKRGVKLQTLSLGITIRVDIPRATLMRVALLLMGTILATSMLIWVIMNSF